MCLSRVSWYLRPGLWPMSQTPGRGSPGDSSSRDVGCRLSALSGFLPHLKRLVFRVGRPRFQKWTRGVRVYVRSALFAHMATVLISVG